MTAPVNELLPFAEAGGANVMTQGDYAALSARPTGFIAGVAQSPQLNKVWRQAAFVAAMIGQFTADNSGNDVLDNADIATFEANFELAIGKYVGLGLITTAKTYTVHGVGADFTDLYAAFAYLSRYTITQSGSVTLNIASGKFTSPYTIPLVIAHPNSDRITINGSAPTSTPPNSVSAATSTFVTSVAQCLTNLRAIYTTEIAFSGSNGSGVLALGRGLTINNLLLTGDGTSSSQFMPNGTGLMSSGLVFTNNLSAHGFYNGIGAQSGGSILAMGLLSGSGCQGYGISASDGSSIAFPKPSTVLVGAYNFAIGIAALNSSSVRTNSGGGAMYTVGNSTWGNFAGSSAFMSIGTGANLQSQSPALNTVGNQNSYIANPF